MSINQLLTDVSADGDCAVPAVWHPLSIRKARAHASPAVEWLWHGYLARGSVTLLTSQWKTGKTTLLSVLAARMSAGGRVADREVAPCRAGIVTEESASHWLRRDERLDLGEAASFFFRPFSGKPTVPQWQRFVAHLAGLRTADKLDLLVVDTLAAFLPRGAENLTDGMLAFLRPLERLTAAGVAVLLLHHPRKGVVQVGQAARGSGALSGYCDVIVELQTIPGAKPDDRRRRLYAWSRHDETPRELVVELSADGRDYAASTDEIDLEWEAGLDVVRAILAGIGKQLSAETLLRQWPNENRRPADRTLWRWLERAAARGFLVRHGEGIRGEPYRYSLPGSNAEHDLAFEISGGMEEASGDMTWRAIADRFPMNAEAREEDDGFFQKLKGHHHRKSKKSKAKHRK